MTDGAVSLADLSVSRHLAYVLQLSLGIVFLISSLPKLRDPRAFVRTVGEHRLLPSEATVVVAAALIAVEGFLALAFTTGLLTDVAVPLAFATLFVFFAAVVINLRRGRHVPCGCFGNSNEYISRATLARLAMLIAAVVVLWAADAIGSPPAAISSLGVGLPQTLRYLIESVMAASFVILAGMWALNARQLRPVLGGLGRFEQARQESGRESVPRAV